MLCPRRPTDDRLLTTMHQDGLWGETCLGFPGWHLQILPGPNPLQTLLGKSENPRPPESSKFPRSEESILRSAGNFRHGLPMAQARDRLGLEILPARFHREDR